MRKVAVIGGGSSYTPELLDGFIERERSLDLREVVLHDLAPERLEAVAGFCRRMARHRGAGFRVSQTLDLGDALAGAAFVVTQVRVGGQEARHRDEARGLRLGIVGQETTGEGGFAKAIRTIPVVLDLARQVRERAPGAWVINFTNPSGIVTEALLRFGQVPTVGLCNVPAEMKMETAAALGVPPEAVELDYVGLNHLGWVRRILVNGEDITDAVLGALSGGRGPKNVPEVDYGPDFFDAIPMIPSPYLRYYYATDEVLRELQAAPKTRAQVVMEIEEALFAYYRDPATVEKPALLSERGGAWYSRVALDVIEGLLSPRPRREVVNTLNRGAIPQVPDDAVVEVRADLSCHGVVPVASGPLPEEILGLIRQVKAYERLTIEAAITRSRGKALAALIANPLVRTVDKARAVLDDLIACGDFRPEDGDG